ncbi:MAG: tetratricopeptide repeat protein [Chloroflexota bacterium]
MFRIRKSSERFKPLSEECIRKCTAEIEKGPDFDAYTERAQWWFDTDDYTRALADYGAALQLRPHPVIYTYRGETLARLGRYSEALADYSRAIDLNPRMTDAYERRASLLATCADMNIRNGVQAIEDAKKACLLSTDRRDCLETLAAAYAQERRFDAAVQTQERALALYPRSSAEGRAEKIAEAERRLALYRQSRA